MKPSEAAEFLASVAGSDRRTVGEVEARAWAAILPEDVTVEEAVRALALYKRESTEFVQPAHIVRLVRAERSAARQAAEAAAAAACLYCRGDGWRDADPEVACDHKPAPGLDNTPKRVVRRPVGALAAAVAARMSVPREPSRG